MSFQSVMLSVDEVSAKNIINRIKLYSIIMHINYNVFDAMSNAKLISFAEYLLTSIEIYIPSTSAANCFNFFSCK